MNEGTVSLRTLKAAEQRISARIAAIRAQLKQVEKLPDWQTRNAWVSFGRVRRVEDLAGKHQSLKEALKADLAFLRTELRTTRREAYRTRTARLRQDAMEASREFEEKVREALREAERSGGGLAGDRLAALQEEGEAVLEQFVEVLDRSPTDENLRLVLKQMVLPMSLGAGADGGGSCDRAMQALERAAGTLHRRAERVFRAVPSVENFTRLLRRTSVAQMVGSVEYGGLPSGVRRLRPETEHVVEPGESLASISRMFYGNPGYWDVIYLANAPEIGDDPARLPAGLVLEIP